MLLSLTILGRPELTSVIGHRAVRHGKHPKCNGHVKSAWLRSIPRGEPYRDMTRKMSWNDDNNRVRRLSFFDLALEGSQMPLVDPLFSYV